MYSPAASAACRSVWPGSKSTGLPSMLERLAISFMVARSMGFHALGQMRVGVIAPGYLAGLGQRGVQVEGRLEVQRLEPLLVGGAELLHRVDDGVARRGAQAAVAERLDQAAQPVQSFRSYWVPWPAASLSIRRDTSVVPTRQGVQKPQLSWAKKCAKLRATSNRSRVRAEHHEGAGGGHVLEGDAAAELVVGQAHARRAGHLHGLRVARAAVLEHLRRRARRRGTRRCPGAPRRRDAESSLVPVDWLGADACEALAAVGGDRQQLASVSTLFTTVGWPR
jgi:hypothetical protein